MNGSFVTLIAIVLIATFTTITQAGKSSEEEAAGKALVKSYAEKCVGKDGVTEKDIDILLEHGGDDGEDVEVEPCLLTCLAEQFGIVKDNVINPGVITALAKAAIKDKSKHDEVEKIANKCSKIPTEERCTIGLELWLCLHEEAKKAGFEVDSLLSM